MSYTCGKFWLLSPWPHSCLNRLRPFQDAVKAGTSNIMCSYQRVNNSYGCANSKTQNGLLKTELGFQVSLLVGSRSLQKDSSISDRASSFRIGMLNTLASLQLWRA